MVIGSYLSHEQLQKYGSWKRLAIDLPKKYGSWKLPSPEAPKKYCSWKRDDAFHDQGSVELEANMINDPQEVWELEAHS